MPAIQRFDISDATQSFARFQRDINRRVDKTVFAAQNYADRTEQWMKKRAPWRDRTTMARKGLTADVEISWGAGGRIPVPGVPREVRMRLIAAHSVPYGRFLEFGMGGNYKILRPAVELFRTRMSNRLRAIWATTGIATDAESGVSVGGDDFP
jgi:hypothetical protein